MVLGFAVHAGAAFAQNAQQDRLKAVQVDPAALKQASEAGNKAASFCFNCHGDAACGDATIPRLAG